MLKLKVTGFTLAIFVISLWLLAFYASRMLRDDMQRQLGEQQFSTVSLVAQNINEHLEDRVRALEQVAQRISPALLADAGSVQAFLGDQPVLSGLFSGGIFVTRQDGTAIAEVPLSMGRVGLNFLDREAVASALKQGKSMIDTPVMGKKPAVPVFDMTAPIRDAKGQVAGALVGVVALQDADFLDHLAQSRYGKTGGYFLVSRKDRMIIISTNKERVMKPLSVPGAVPAIDRFIEGYEGTQVYINPFGVEVMNSGKYLTAVDWGVSVSIPTEEALAAVRDMQQRMLLATIALTVLAGLLTWWMLRRQLSPMLDTARTLAQLADSDQPPQPLLIKSDDEIGKLIRGFNRLLVSISEREEQIRQFAFYDTLTDLPNRRLLYDRLRQTLAANRRSAARGALMLLDLDNFKPLNDLHGHAAGDSLLIEVGRRLKACVRQEDTVARFGGDEFVVMLAQLPEDLVESTAQARSIAEKIRIALGTSYSLGIVTQDGSPRHVEHVCSASIGVTLFDQFDMYPDEIIRRADLAMYLAKERGRDAVEFAPQSMPQDGQSVPRPMNLVQLNWRSAYKSGNEVIDEQHRCLFDDANRLLTAVLAGQSTTQVAALIDSLIRDVGQHFDAEVKIIMAAGFPGAAAHAQIHAELIARATELMRRFQTGDLGIGELFQYLAHDVVARHMLKEDREFFAYLRH